jgi:hypothetical protein
MLSSAGAAETNLVLDYDVRFGPVRLLEMRARVELEKARYRTSAEMRTVGMVALLFPWQSAAHSAGVRSPGSLSPFRHWSEGTYRGEKRLVEIDYDDGGLVRSHIEPLPQNDWRAAVPPDMQQGTMDPLSATIAAVDSNCRGTLRVFDGRRRYDLHLTDLGTVDVQPSGDHIYAGPARHCRALVEALGGFWRSDPRQSETPTTLESWIAVPRPGLRPLPVYLELRGAQGTLSINLTAVQEKSAGTT